MYAVRKKERRLLGRRSIRNQSVGLKSLVTMSMSAASSVPAMAAVVMVVPAMMVTVPAMMMAPVVRVAMPMMVMTTGADMHVDGGRRRCRHGNRSRCKQRQD